MRYFTFLLMFISAGLLAFKSGPAAAHETFPFDKTAKVEKAGKDIYVILHQDATDEWPHSNVGVIIGDDAVLVVDADYLPSRARADIALIKKLTPKPVKYLVYTHWHFDHNYGGIAYADSFPNIKIISERESQKFIELNDTWWSKMSTAPNSARRLALKGLEDELAKGKDTAGIRFTDEVKSNREKVIAQRKNELLELASLKVITPNTTFDGVMNLQLGNRKIQIRDWGKANSIHDVTIYVPDEQVLFTGDILVQSPLPYAFGSWPLPWIKVLKEMEQIPVKTVVLGHGPLQHDFAYMKQVRLFFEDAVAKVEVLIREGKTLKEAQKQINLDNHLKAPWNKDQQAFDDFKTTVEVLVERVWKGLRGQG